MNHRPASRFVLAVSVVAVVACGDQASPADFAGKQLTSMQLLAATTNAVADDPLAADLGQQVFFDRGLSSDGTVACVDCHDPANGFSDPKARSVGVRGQRGDRHAMPVTAAVFHPFLLWDGKADSPWLQPLKAIEMFSSTRSARLSPRRQLLAVRSPRPKERG
jgi:cytochrome c peroxidase